MMSRRYLFIVVGLLVVLAACQGRSQPETVDEPLDPRDESQSQDVEELVNSGRASLEAGNYDEAVSTLEEAVEQAPNNRDAHFLLGQAYNQNGELSKAVDAYRKVLEIEPESAAAHHNLGVTYYQLQDLRAAMDQFEKALEIDPDDADTHYQLGAAYLTLALSGSEPGSPGDPELLEQATAEFETALELRENMPEALIGLGNVQLQQGNYSAAIDALQQALESVPNSREAHYALAGAFAQSGNIEKACETYDQFLSLDPPAAWKAQAEQTMASLGCR